MLRGLILSLLVHAVVLGLSVIVWPVRQSDCERQIAKLEREEPGIAAIDIAMRLPQCANTIDIPIDVIDVGLITDIAAIAIPEDARVDPNAVQPDPSDETVPEIEDPNNLTPDEMLEANSTRAEDDDALAVDERADKKTAPDPDKKDPKKDPLVEKSRPKEASDDLSFLDDLEDQLRTKARTQREQMESDEPPPIQKPVLDKAQAPRPGAGERKGNTASLSASLRRQIEYCWRGIDDLPEEDQIDVKMNLSLAKDGTLSGDVELVSPSVQPPGRAGIPVDLALRAVRKCAPYKLPPDDYAYWKDISVTIGPKR